MASRTHTLTVDLTVGELYILLGYHWYQGATTLPPVCGAHLRMAQACKLSLLQIGEAAPHIQAKLHGIMREMGIQVDPLAQYEEGREYYGFP